MARKGSKKPSIYQTFWDTLKKKKAITVKVPPLLIERFVKGIKKRKDRDHELKSLNAIDPLRLEFMRKVESDTSAKVTVFLKQTIGLHNIITPEEFDLTAADLELEDI